MQPFGQQSIFNQNSPELTKLNRGKLTNCSEIRRVTSSVFVHPLFAFCRHSPQLILRLYYVLGTDDDQPSELSTLITGLCLKDYLQTKLDNAWIARTCHLTETNWIEQEECADLVEVGVIQHIRCFHAKLNIHPFTNAGVLKQ